MKIFLLCVNLWFIFVSEKFMCCKSFGSRIIAFTLTLAIGWVTANIERDNSIKSEAQDTESRDKVAFSENGTGLASCSNKIDFSNSKINEWESHDFSGIIPLQIISKPRPLYTDAARQNQTQGTVKLRVAFLSTGEIGSVASINELPDGLTEASIAAAKQIKFKPYKAHGIARTVTKVIQYNFSIY